MKRIAISALIMGAMSAPVFAGGHCEENTCVVNKGGKVVWTVESLDPPTGTNPGGKGRTDKAAPGLLKAVGAGGLSAQ